MVHGSHQQPNKGLPMTTYVNDLDNSTKVVNIRSKEPILTDEPIESLVWMLEDLLENAKSGKLRTFDGIGFLSDGNRITATGPIHDNLCEMIGGIELMKQELINK
jgi:hypothetical protein